jgi:hypothetical protein
VAFKLRLEGANEEQLIQKAVQDVRKRYELDAQNEMKQLQQEKDIEDTVRYMETPEEREMVEIPTEPKELEEMPESRGLGALSWRDEVLKRYSKLTTQEKGIVDKELSKQATEWEPASEVWEHEELDKERDRLSAIFSEFADHRKARNYSSAQHLADVLIRRIPEYTGGIVKLFNMDAKLRAPSSIKIENTMEKLKMWKTILNSLEDYVRLEKPVSEKRPGLSVRRKSLETEAGGDEMLTKLYKLADTLDKRGEFELADEVSKVIETLIQRVGMEEMVALGDYFDEIGDTKSADRIDEMLSEAKKKTPYKVWKGKDEKPPNGAEKKSPKGWFDKMKKEIKQKNPDYSAKRVSEVVGDIWDNTLSDAKRKKIFKEYGKKGDPNK